MVGTAERRFGLYKRTLLTALIPIAEGLPSFGGLGMTTGSRFVLTQYAHAEALRRFGGDISRLSAASEAAAARKATIAAASAKERAEKDRLGGEGGRLSDHLYTVLTNPASC